MVELGLICKIYLANQAKLPCFQRRKAPEFATFGKNGHFALRWARFKATARPHISPTGIPKPHFAHRQLRSREGRPRRAIRLLDALPAIWHGKISNPSWPLHGIGIFVGLAEPLARGKGHRSLKQESGARPARSAREMRFKPIIAGSSHFAMQDAYPYAQHGRFSCKLCRGSECPSGQTPA